MQKYTVRHADQLDYNQLVAFNERMYPERAKAKGIIDFWLSKDEKALTDCLLLVGEDNVVYGQVIVSRMEYFSCDKVWKSAWLFDLIVVPELQKTAQGAMLMMYCKKHYPTSCSTGANPNALQMHLKLGNKEIGEIRKYVRIGSPWKCVNSIFRKELNSKSFPTIITEKSSTFKRIDDITSVFVSNAPYNRRLFEPCRDLEFLRWRFYNDLHGYAVYFNTTTNDYFVVRTIVKYGILCLVLVDYRCNAEDITRVDSIIDAVGYIAKNKKIGIVITGSSLNKFDDSLEKRNYRQIGRPRPVLGFVDVKDASDSISKRDFCFVTLADSDGETNL